ncbi:hypothetical protein DRQ11_02875 [candidate division KSB1 bacterium]|nr:MAG: hypothetical protein DRQ11_02875 [candidate division KSB1 bacterium]HDI52261.1 hypothetical protein [Bacteroidota bacterium]
MMIKRFILPIMMGILGAELGLFAQFSQKSPRLVPLQFLFAFGNEGDELGAMRSPLALSIDPSGNLYVADTGNHRIQKFDTRGTYQRYIGGIGWNEAQFDHPTDIWAASSLDVFVADYNNQRIQRFDRHLNYLSSLRSSTDWDAIFQFGFPYSVALSRQGDLFLSDDEHNRILKLDSFGQPIISFGGMGSMEGNLKQPGPIWITHGGLLFVTDLKGAQILRFDYFGNFLGNLGIGYLKAPLGLTFDEQRQYLFVADPGSATVWAFSLKGEVIPVMLIQHTEQSDWQKPVDVAVWRDQLFVLDQNEPFVKVYRMLGM